MWYKKLSPDNLHILPKCKNRKRLCLMIPVHWSRRMGGSQYQVKCLIQQLEKTDRFEVYYLTRDCEPNYRNNGYKLIRYGYPGAHIHGAHRHLIEMVLLPKILQQIDPDVIYQRIGCAQTGVAARYAVKNNCKMVWHIAGEADLTSSKISFSRLLVYRFIDRYLLNYGIRHATHIIAQTEDQKKLLNKIFHREPSAVIPNFHPTPIETVSKQYPIKVLWVANLKDVKQPEIFIRLARELQDLPNTEFIMVGDLQGPERVRQKYRRLIAHSKTLKYLGTQSQENVNSLMAQSHIFVSTSRKEGFPNTFIQAWMRQVPVVSLIVDPDQLIQKNFLGFVSGSFENLKQDVVALTVKSDLREQIGQSARDFSMKHFSMKNAEAIVQVLDEPFIRFFS